MTNFAALTPVVWNDVTALGVSHRLIFDRQEDDLSTLEL